MNWAMITHYLVVALLQIVCILPANLVATTHHIGVIGNDSLATYTIGEYKKQGIEHSFSNTQVSGDSGCCIVLIAPDGERTMLTYLGVSSQFKSVQFMKQLIQQSHSLFIEGYLLSDQFCYAMLRDEIIPAAKSSNTNLILSLSDAGLVSFFHDQFQELVSLGFDTIFAIVVKLKHYRRLQQLTTFQPISIKLPTN